jgi:nitrite reductase/ring-hydroxylating ferredoxin subunit
MTELHLAGSYVREVQASLARIRENVLDWEHLAALHSSSFTGVELVDEDADGWRIKLTGTPVGKKAATPQLLKLFLEADTSAYRVVTEDGPGAGSEIRVTVTRRSPHLTGIRVEYHVAEADPDRLALIGKGFVTLYRRLWDEDEVMMRAREIALTPRRKTNTPARLVLGLESDIRQRLPLAFDFRDGRFHLVEVNGQLAAHSTRCPHWLGPLEGPPDASGTVTCPWHGYRFDAVTGCSADGRGLKLAPAPSIRIDHGRVIAEPAADTAAAA